MDFSDETNANLTLYGLNWSQIPPSLKKRIEEFSILWPVFEQHFANGFFNPQTIRNEIAKGSRFAKSLGENAQSMLKPSFEYFRTRYTDPGHFDALMNGRTDVRQDIQVGLTTAAPWEDQNQALRLTALIFVVYRLRNNLFHGEKARTLFFDEEKNLLHGVQIMNVLLTNR